MTGLIIKNILLVVAAYFIGNISPAILLGKVNGIDIKKEGSGNAGTTNVLRVLGKKAAAITLIIDISKGFFATWLGFFAGDYRVGTICAAAVFCGHIWPCFFQFKGGKGVATAFGAILAVNWTLALTVLIVVIFGVLISRRMSVGSLLGAISFPVLAWFMENGFFIPGTIMAVIVVVKHRANIKRLFHGEEPKMSFKK